MRMEFKTRDDGPARLVAEGVLVFGDDAGPLSGMSLHGFSLWRSADGETFVTVPSRGGAGRFSDIVRSTATTDAGRTRQFKQWVLDAWNAAEAAR